MLMKRLILAVLAMGAFCAPAYAADAPPPEPACGTQVAAKPCLSFTTGAVSVVTRDVRREYATVGAELATQLGQDFSAWARGDIFAVQDGAGTDAAIERTFRVLKLEAGVSREVGALRLNALGGVTYSWEGQVGAPIDPRQWDALIDVQLLVAGGHVAVRGGHDGAVGGWAAGADVEIPVADGPAIVARYELPLQRDPAGRVPWVITAGGRIRVASFRLRK
jgi:hypothetical protein